MIIKLYDSCGDMGILEIVENSFKEFKELLDKYTKDNQEEYNYDDFLNILKEKKLLIKEIIINEEVYF